MPKKRETTTANSAARQLELSDSAFVVPSPTQRRLLLTAFAERNFVVYGKAYDLVRLSGPVDLSDLDSIREHLDLITVYEIKSTNKVLPATFEGYFFAITGAEMLVAQSLKHRFRFAFVNTVTGAVLDLTLRDVLSRIRGIYPTWSIRF